MLYNFYLTETGKNGLRAAFAVWTTRIQGLAKLVTRIQIPWQVRECSCVAPGPVMESGRALATNA